MFEDLLRTYAPQVLGALLRLREQLAAGTHHSSFMVIRLMLPPFTRYEAKKQEFAPFNRLAAPQPEMRDDVLFILRAAEEAELVDDHRVDQVGLGRRQDRHRLAARAGHREQRLAQPLPE